MLKFLIDQNVPKSVSVFLRKEKYNIKLVKDINPEMSDLQVIKNAVEEKRIVLSNDKDFINLAVKHQKVDIILFDYLEQSAAIRIKGLKKILKELKKPFGIIILQ